MEEKKPEKEECVELNYKALIDCKKYGFVLVPQDSEHKKLAYREPKHHNSLMHGPRKYLERSYVVEMEEDKIVNGNGSEPNSNFYISVYLMDDPLGPEKIFESVYEVGGIHERRGAAARAFRKLRDGDDLCLEIRLLEHSDEGGRYCLNDPSNNYQNEEVLQ